MPQQTCSDANCSNRSKKKGWFNYLLGITVGTYIGAYVMALHKQQSIYLTKSDKEKIERLAADCAQLNATDKNRSCYLSITQKVIVHEKRKKSSH